MSQREDMVLRLRQDLHQGDMAPPHLLGVMGLRRLREDTGLPLHRVVMERLRRQAVTGRLLRLEAMEPEPRRLRADTANRRLL